MRRWWAAKLRRTWRYLRARVSASERAVLAAWLTPPQLRLFDSMHVADRRHGLDVAEALRARGAATAQDTDLLLAGLFHDAGKGPRTRLAHRVAWSLGQAYGAWVWRLLRPLPTFAAGLERMRTHAEVSARLALEAGCSQRTADLIRNQGSPVDEPGRLLAAADEAN